MDTATINMDTAAAARVVVKPAVVVRQPAVVVKPAVVVRAARSGRQAGRRWCASPKWS